MRTVLNLGGYKKRRWGTGVDLGDVATYCQSSIRARSEEFAPVWLWPDKGSGLATDGRGLERMASGCAERQTGGAHFGGCLGSARGG